MVLEVKPASPDGAETRSAPMRPAVWFTLGFILLQTAWILTVPPFRGSDEFDHAYRAAAVAGGQWVATEPAANGRGLLLEVPASLVDAASAQCDELPYTGPDNCNTVGPADDEKVLVASGAATYFPLFYAVVGVVGSLADGASSLYLMRVATALLCTTFVLGAAWASTRSPSRWPLAGMVLALSPVLIYSTGIVAPNGLEMTAAVSLWCSLAAIGSDVSPRVERGLILLASVSACVMCVLRLLGPLFVVAIVILSIAFRGRVLWAAVRRNRAITAAGSTVVLASVATFLWWLKGPANVAVPTSEPEGSASLGAIYGLLWPLQTIAAFPYRNQPGPLIVYGVVAALVVSFLTLALRRSAFRTRVVIVVACLGALALPFIATLLTLDGRGVIWQGRYGLPLSVGFILLSGFTLSTSRGSDNPPRGLVVASLAAYGIAVLACYLKVRAAELDDNLASVSDSSWHIPSPVMLTLLVVASMGALARAILASDPADG